MNIARSIPIILFSLTLQLSTYSHAQTIKRETELKQLYQQNQAMQSSLPSKLKSAQLQINNAERRSRVMEMLVEDLPWQRDDFKKAALVFQHTNTGGEPEDKEEFRSQEGHLLCFYLARQNRRMGGTGFEATCIWRYLIASKLPQKLGLEAIKTPFVEFTCLTNPSISDEERMSLGFPFRLSKAIKPSCPSWFAFIHKAKKDLQP
jgi:hypothetical protein